jgi:uncharacterized glyoxalase superfamily protein PhnB
MAARKKTTKAVARARRAKRATAKRRTARPARRATPAVKGLRLQSAGPSYTVDDVEKSLAFYRDVLDCAIGERWERDGRLLGVEVKAGAVSFWLSQDDWKKGRGRAKGEGFRIYCETRQDVDRLAEGIKARGGRLSEEPHDEPWGGRSFTIVDPDGFKLSITRA